MNPTNTAPSGRAMHRVILDEPDPEAGGGSFPAHRLPAKMLVQEENNWCWSAVTQAVYSYLNGKTITQQDIGTKHISESGRNFTCAPPNRTKTSGNCSSVNRCKGKCNAFHVLRKVLTEYNLFNSTLSAGKWPSFEEVRSEIDMERPVACLVRWSGNLGAHFILVVGYRTDRSGTKFVDVLDPHDGSIGNYAALRSIEYQSFTRRYKSRSSSFGAANLIGEVDFSYRVA